MKKQRRRVTQRTPERLIRAAYEFEHLAASLTAEGYSDEGATVRQVSSLLGDCGRGLRERIGK